MFMRNQWYVAAMASEIGDRPLGRTVCGEDIVMFRRKDSSVVVLEDRCPHRKAPLSLGQVIGDDIECPYHGLRLNGNGACTLIPSQQSISRGLNAKVYPAIEAHKLLFVWIGEAEKADPALLPDWSMHTSPEWETVFGYHHVKANYLLVVDNLLDLTHLAFVHRTTLGASGPGDWLEQQKVWTEGDFVRTRRVMRNVPPSGLVKATKRFTTEKIDRFQESWFRAPSYVMVTIGSELAGTHDDMEHPHHVVPNSITPETENTTHYFWSTARRYALSDPAVSEVFWNVTKTAFDEDQAMIEAQQLRIDSDPRKSPLANLEGDAASVAARRLVAKKIASEAMVGAQAAE
jgi:vanillate O-demethylase monooxygenase subunit